MKTYWLAWVILVSMVACGCNKQPRTSSGTNTVSNTSINTTNQTVTKLPELNSLKPYPVESVFEDTKRLATEKGDPLAEFALGMFYYDGKRVAQDFVEAVKWFHKSADQGYAVAQDALGLSYYLGIGVTKDAGEAAKWFREAAD
jgi:TPR repeat protein